MAIAALDRLKTKTRDVSQRRFSLPTVIMHKVKGARSTALIIAGWGLISAGAFTFSTTVGLVSTGAILMVIERQIDDGS